MARLKKFTSKNTILYIQKIAISICIFVLLGSLPKFPSYKVQLFYLILCFLFSFVLVFRLNRNRVINKLVKLLLLLGLIELIALMFTLLLHCLTERLYTPIPDMMETAFFQNKNVMIIVPHEDDDINLAGGVIENYIKEGSDVRVVFATNGDYYGIGELRLKEAVNVLTHMGLKEENIIFLGYGDQWQPMSMPDGREVNHIYNSTEDLIWTSYNLKKGTYGLYDHLPYHENDYTRSNFLTGIEDVILEYRPEIIYVNDYDVHIDHRAVSLLFEEAMGNILSSIEGYTPVILKGYCYETAWHAADDFMEMNMVSTMESDTMSLSMYRWENRIRIPVTNLATSTLISQSSVYKALNRYTSQRASQRAGRIINGDKVFWKRNTESILYSAQITYENTVVSKLTDFKLIDSLDISDRKNNIPEDGVLVLKENEAIEIQLCENTNIMDICLYDNPNRESNILEGKIIFDTGDIVNFEALDPYGNMTKIVCNVNNAKSFKVVVTKMEGGVRD